MTSNSYKSVCLSLIPKNLKTNSFSTSRMTRQSHVYLIVLIVALQVMFCCSLAKRNATTEAQERRAARRSTFHHEEHSTRESDTTQARNKCKEAEKLVRRRNCFERGHTVAFVPGAYLCCANINDSDLMALGSSAFWVKSRGFCGRGACELCEKTSQQCVVFDADNVFCCTKGFTIR